MIDPKETLVQLIFFIAVGALGIFGIDTVQLIDELPEHIANEVAATRLMIVALP
jgi:hypothetical protein